MMKTNVHLQNAKDIGGTYSTPPLATTKLDAINIGWINKSEKGKRFFILVFNGSKVFDIYFLSKKAS